jgi:hypothetical protein
MKIKLPSTTALKHQIRMRMARYEIENSEAEVRPEAPAEKCSEELLLK